MAMVAGGVMLALQFALIAAWWLQRRRARALDGRVAHLSAAVALLTDTLEGGLHDVAREVARLSAAAAVQPAPVVATRRAAAQRRVRGAAKRGRTVREIAAAEEMSEGEVRLMLQTPGREITEPVAHAEMR
jgi:hypothetical protein